MRRIGIHASRILGSVCSHSVSSHIGCGTTKLRHLSTISVGPFRAARSLNRQQEFLLAAVGEGIAEVEVIEYHVKVGDRISQFDKVLDVQTDKATVEITSRYDGIVKAIHYTSGQVAKVGTSLITLEVSDSVVSDAETSKSEETPISVSSSSPVVSDSDSSIDNDKVLTIPAVRRIAKENNIDLSMVKGTGAGGRIMKEDVLRYISDGKKTGSKSEYLTPPRKEEPKIFEQKPVDLPIATPSIRVNAAEDRVQPITGLQRMMVKSMTAALSVPALGLSEEIDVDALMHLRNVIKSEAAKRNVKLSFLPILMKCASQALKEYPLLNSHVNTECTEVYIKGRHNIGIAMDTARGLLVPSIKDVQDKSILEIAADLNRLQALGMEGKLGQDDLSGGTFTLSNIGSIGGTYTSPIVVVPQVVIGALGRIQKLPRYNKHGELRPASIMTISWSADHRVVDGATITRFSNLFKQYVEHPDLLLLDTR